jgi:two-component system response regulator PilR (NtrC family)
MEEGVPLLIVEPHREMRTLLQHFFARQQVAVQAVPSVAAAMASLAQHPVQVVLTDLFLPDAEGIALVQHVQQVAPETRVIVMGAFTAPATQQQAIAAGASAFLEKPFSLARLEVVVRHALQGAPGQ